MARTRGRQDVELGPGPVCTAAAQRRRGCCGGVCSFILSHWSKAALLAIIVSLIVLVSVRVSAARPPCLRGLSLAWSPRLPSLQRLAALCCGSLVLWFPCIVIPLCCGSLVLSFPCVVVPLCCRSASSMCAHLHQIESRAAVWH